MTSQETIIHLFEGGMSMLTKSTLAVPEDKVDWKPAEGSRTIRQLYAESVMMPLYVAKALTQRAVPPYDELATEYAALSITELTQRFNTNAQELFAALRAFPESEYENTLEAPWGTWTYFQTMGYPYWNMMWHAGQINYIQTMYGDQGFYF